MNKQPISKQNLINKDTLPIYAIYHTIQTEGPFANLPAIFVRLGGCNLQCPLCDEDYTSNVTEHTLDRIMLEIKRLAGAHTTLVVITGGEPFRVYITELVYALAEEGFVTQIETNGTLWIEDFPIDLAHIVCSPKTPKVHPMIAEHADAWKYIIAQGNVADDGLPLSVLDKQNKSMVARPGNDAAVYLQPQDSHDEKRNAHNAKACVKSILQYGYTLSFQSHKYLGID